MSRPTYREEQAGQKYTRIDATIFEYQKKWMNEQGINISKFLRKLIDEEIEKDKSLLK